MTRDEFLVKIKADLDKALEKSPGIVEAVKESGENALMKMHFSLGMWLRNNWGLWSGYQEGPNELVKFFNEQGIYHADDMSGIILACYARLIRNESINFDAQLQVYFNHWAEAGVDVKADSEKAHRKWLMEQFKEKKE